MLAFYYCGMNLVKKKKRRGGGDPKKFGNTEKVNDAVLSS